MEQAEKEAEARMADKLANRAEGGSQSAADCEPNGKPDKGGNLTKPSLISVLAEKQVEKERPGLNGKAKIDEIKKKAIVI